jgi:hypothetical protein
MQEVELLVGRGGIEVGSLIDLGLFGGLVLTVSDRDAALAAERWVGQHRVIGMPGLDNSLGD